MLTAQDEREKIVRLHANTVWRVALSRTRREDAAEEVFQEVFLRLFKKERSFEDEEHRKAWLIRTTLICCRRYLSAYFSSASLSLDEIAESACSTLPEEASGLYEAILALPAKYRVPIVLYYVEELPAERCVEVLKLNPSTFRTRLQRGRQLLKNALKGGDFHD